MVFTTRNAAFLLLPFLTTFLHASMWCGRCQKAWVATGVAGKWQLNKDGDGSLPETTGFDDDCVWYIEGRAGSRSAGKEKVEKKSIEN